MKVLRVISSMNPELGGPSQGIRNSVPALEQIGISNEIVSLDDPAADFLTRSKLKIHAIGAGKGPWFYHAALEPWLKENLARFDVVIIHGLWLYPSYATIKVLKKLRRAKKQKLPKVFVMPHGMLDPYFQKAEGRRLKAIRNSIYWKFIERRVVNMSDGLIFTCEEELRLARTTFPGYHPKTETNVGYGTTTPAPYNERMKQAFRQKCENLEDKPYLLFLSRVHPKKGVDMLIEVYLEMKKKYTSIPPLVIAGPGLETDFGEQLVKLAASDNDIQFTGMLSGDEKLGALYGCEALILPSHQENFGIAIAESLACGNPVLISNKVNIWREIVADNGGFVEDDTKDGVEKLLKRWLDLSSAEKEKMTANARGVFEKNFSVEQFAARLARMFNS